MTGRLEATHRSFTLPRRLMRVFCPVVEAFVSAMLNTWHDFLLCRLVAPELIRDQNTRDVLATPEQLAEELLRSSLVPSALHQDIKDVPILVYCAPQLGRFAVDFQKHFIQKPLVSRLGTPPPKLIGIGLPEPQTPLTYGFVRHGHTPFSEQVLDVAVAKAKAEVEPNRVRDDFLMVAKPFVR